MDTETRPTPRSADELMIVAVKIPRRLVAVIDNAAGNSWQTRNTIVKEALENHFKSKNQSSH